MFPRHSLSKDATLRTNNIRLETSFVFNPFFRRYDGSLSGGVQYSNTICISHRSIDLSTPLKTCVSADITPKTPVLSVFGLLQYC